MRGNMAARSIPPEVRHTIPVEGRDAPAPASEPPVVGSGQGFVPASLPGVVAFTAAADGTPALEQNGAGIFTDALLRVLVSGSATPLTYAQVARRVAPLVAAASYQIPYFQGDLDRALFARGDSARPTGWEVTDPGSPLKLSGVPLPGIDRGAELRIYDGAISGADSLDPEKALATVIVTKFTGVNAEAAISATGQGARRIRAGDLAVLIRPADDVIKLKLQFRAGSGGGAIPSPRAEAIRNRIRGDPEASGFVELVDKGGDFELSAGSGDRLVLRGPENRVRNTITSDETVPETLWHHARQRALLLLQGEGGGQLVDNQTLQVRLIPSNKQPPCAKGGWVQAGPQQEQVVPLCYHFNVQVKLDEHSPMSLLVGALILSSDGSIFGLPRDERTVLLRSGETVTFAAPEETFSGAPPLDTQDHVLVFGTQERNPVAWHQLTQSAASRGLVSAGGLYGALDRYLRPGSRLRGVGQVDEKGNDETVWTMSALAMRVEANSRFLEPQSGADAKIAPREYTLKTFDVRPYLPDDVTTALYKVLQKADWLATTSREEGFGYKQHPWTVASDEANLHAGIDCSRAIWFVFTRAGLSYNHDNRYLTTADMLPPGTAMSSDFVQCPVDEDVHLGDVLVYHSDTRHDGHVVMVIDAGKRIAWGSHGWDGDAQESHYAVPAETGVEYQRIKYKPDWQRWDRPDMELKACWRYRRFQQDVERGIGVPGIKALSRVCSDEECAP
jgi:hypothetical protein